MLDLDGAELGDPFLADFFFEWPRDCTVPVVEAVLKDGKVATLEYNLRVRSDGQDRVVTFDAMTVKTFDGKTVPSVVAQTLAAQFTLPGFVVGPDGFVTELVGMEAVIEQLAALDPSGNFEMTPELVALLQESVVEKYWGSWVGVWSNWGYFDEATEFGTSEIQVGSDVATSDIVMESLGTVDGSLVALRSTITLDGDDFTLAIGGALDTVTGTDGSSAPSDFVGWRVVTVEVVTDPATLRPESAFTSVAVEVTADGETDSQVEERRWRFDWDTCS